MSSTAVPWLVLLNREQAATRQEKVCAMLRSAIRSGQLAGGTRLPSSRLLAVDLALSRITVEAAYVRLESEGYLIRQAGRGTFVAEHLAARTTRVARSTTPVLSRRGQQIVAGGGCDDPPFPQAFAAGSPDLRAFPLRLWQRLTRQRLRWEGESLLGYGDPQGLPALREAIAVYLGQSRGVRCHAGQVMVLTSSQQALQMIALLLCDPGDRVWLEAPGYPGAWQAFNGAGAVVEDIPLDNQGAQIPTDAPPPRLVYLTPSHQYPTGITLGLQRRLAWLAFARQQGCWLIEDDYDSEFHYDGRPMPALQGLEPDARTLYVGTFSKVLFPSLRLAYLVVPEGLIDALRRLRSTLDGHSAQLMQAVTADFMQQGHFAAHLRLMRQLYASRRDLLLQALAERLPTQLTPLPHQGGLQLTVLLNGGDEQRLTREAAAGGLLLPPLSPLCRHTTPQQGWILGYSALQPGEIMQAVDKLARLSYRD